MYSFINGKQVFCGYRVFYNPETLKYEFESEPSPVLSNSPVDEWIETLEHAIERVEQKNMALENGSLKIVYCSDCGQFFSLDKSEMEWYQDRGFALPKRCFSCRDKRKNQNSRR